MEPQPNPSTMPADWTTADIIVETLIAWGVPVIFGMVGDGIGPLIEAISVRQDKIRYVGVRHEEAAAFMACGLRQAYRAAWCLHRHYGPRRYPSAERAVRCQDGQCPGHRHHRSDFPRPDRH